jgi:predicted enzyme related to lactoylglutathione lyase
MQSFGAMGLGGLFGSGPLMAGNPFDAFFGFSDLHQQLNKAGEEGTFVFQAQMTSIEMGPDGRPIIENYF